jgi:anti-anti-sigma factor
MTTDHNGRPAQPNAPQPNAPQPDAPQQNEPDAPILDQAFDAGSLYALRAAVAAHASSAGLAPGRADDLVIAVHELAANAVRHGAGHGRLRVWRSDHALLCEITDDGLPDPQQADDGLPDGAQEAQTTPEWRAEPGHGLSLVRQVADQTTLRSGRDGTSATISFVLAPPGGPPFALARQQHQHCTVLTVTGPLDLTSAAQLTQAVQEELRSQKARLILDLHRLTGWDAAGLAALITAQQQVSAAPDARLVLAALPAQLEEHLRDAGTSDRFTLAADQAQAQRKLSEP